MWRRNNIEYPVNLYLVQAHAFSNSHGWSLLWLQLIMCHTIMCFWRLCGEPVCVRQTVECILWFQQRSSRDRGWCSAWGGGGTGWWESKGRRSRRRVLTFTVSHLKRKCVCQWNLMSSSAVWDTPVRRSVSACVSVCVCAEREVTTALKFRWIIYKKIVLLTKSIFYSSLMAIKWC